jgi:DNA polymerase-3 subunit beta
MSIKVQKKDLLDAVQKAFPIVPTKTSLMILCSFRVSYGDSILKILATDIDHSLQVTVGADGDGEFDIAVNARKIFDVVKELPDGLVTIHVEDMVFHVEAKDGLYGCKISGADPVDFPEVPKMDGGVEFDVSAAVFRDMLHKSSFAVSKDETRAYLSGVLWELSPEKIGMVATDGHRLGYSFVDSELSIDRTISNILSKKSVSTLDRITDSGNQDEFLSVIVCERYVSFGTPSFTMVSKLIEGKYPDYGKVIPRNNPRVVVIDRLPVLDVAKRVVVLANARNNFIKFTFKDGKMNAHVLNKDIGAESWDSVPVEYDGEEHVVGLDGKLFIEILEILKTDKVRIEMNTQISACVIHPVYADEKDKVSEDLFLLMPLRIMDEF